MSKKKEEKEIIVLEKKISTLITEIDKGTGLKCSEPRYKDGILIPGGNYTNDTTLEIIKLLAHLKRLDEASYETKMKDYKIAYDVFNKKHQTSKNAKEKRAKTIDSTINRVGKGGDAGPVALGGDDAPKASRQTKAPREPKVPKVKLPSRDKGDRDRKSYKFGGADYGKGPLVLAIIRAYVAKNPKAGLPQMKTTFPDPLLKGYGVFQELARAREISKTHNRFFLKDAQLIRISGATIAVCNQWSRDNIGGFIDHATKLGFKIE